MTSTAKEGDGTNVYGVSKAGVYRLASDSDSWDQVAPEIQDDVTSLAVDGDMLYVGTESRGLLYFNLSKK